MVPLAHTDCGLVVNGAVHDGVETIDGFVSLLVWLTLGKHSYFHFLLCCTESSHLAWSGNHILYLCQQTMSYSKDDHMGF